MSSNLAPLAVLRVPRPARGDFDDPRSSIRDPRSARPLLAGLLAAAATLGGEIAQAQYRDPPGQYQPLNQSTPPGRAAAWQAQIGNLDPNWFQPVRIELPDGGLVTFYEILSGPDGLDLRETTFRSPAQASLRSGGLYRFALSEMPDFDGIDLYPSIEVLDRLHPPAGQADRFPVVVAFTTEELQAAANGKLVTKVVYLEQPQLAIPTDSVQDLIAERVGHRLNVLAEADRRGRPLAIVRLGARVPERGEVDPGFYGTPQPLRFPAEQPKPVRPPVTPANPAPPKPEAPAANP